MQTNTIQIQIPGYPKTSPLKCFRENLTSSALPLKHPQCVGGELFVVTLYEVFAFQL